MHGSHKLWITVSVFIVVIAFLLAMYFSATPEEMNKAIEKRKAVAEKKRELKERMKAGQNQKTQTVYEDTDARTMVLQEQSLPDELQSLDLESIKAEGSDMVLTDEDNGIREDNPGQ